MPRPAEPAPRLIRIVSWNIHGSIGLDRRCDPDRILAHIAALRPDVLALQEVDGRTHLGRRAGAFEFFAEALGGHCVEARLIRRPGRDYGHLLWSRWPVAEAEVRLLPFGQIEQRGVIDAHIAAPGSALRLLSTHFGLSPFARRRQAKILAALAGGSAVPTVALGDLNEWRAGGWVHQALAAELPVTVRQPSWPSRRPRVPMDRFYASADITVEASEAVAAAAGASDHLPLVVDIALPPG